MPSQIRSRLARAAIWLQAEPQPERETPAAPRASAPADHGQGAVESLARKRSPRRPAGSKPRSKGPAAGRKRQPAERAKTPATPAEP